MFPAEKAGEWEPYKVKRLVPSVQHESNGGEGRDGVKENDGNVAYEEDLTSEDGAVSPIVQGQIVDWPCFFALMTHVYNVLNPPFHTPILLISQPAWTPRDHEKLTQFFFEKFKMPAFAIMDAAMSACYAYGVHTATVVDVGLDKTDVTAITEFLIHDVERCVALPDCGGEAMTRRLLDLLGARGFTREMCEQLKKSPICEVLPPGMALPGPADNGHDGIPKLPPGAINGGAPVQRSAAATTADVIKRTGSDAGLDDEPAIEEEKEGVLDVASIVAGGKMSEYLARKEKEKQEKSTKKKGADSAANPAKPARLPNNKRERNTFLYEDQALSDALKDMRLDGRSFAEAQAALDEGPQKRQRSPGAAESHNAAPDGDAVVPNELVSPTEVSAGHTGRRGPIRREIEVGVERFQAASGGILDTLADAIYRTISSVEVVNKRSELWDSIIFVGNGSRLRGSYFQSNELNWSHHALQDSRKHCWQYSRPDTSSHPLPPPYSHQNSLRISRRPLPQAPTHRNHNYRRILPRA